MRFTCGSPDVAPAWLSQVGFAPCSSRNSPQSTASYACFAERLSRSRCDGGRFRGWVHKYPLYVGWQAKPSVHQSGHVNLIHMTCTATTAAKWKTCNVSLLAPGYKEKEIITQIPTLKQERHIPQESSLVIQPPWPTVYTHKPQVTGAVLSSPHQMLCSYRHVVCGH